MPRLSDASRMRRRDDLAAAAMRCFARDGFSRTSMADIIREAGSSSGSVYSNFENKTELVRYAASGALRRLIPSTIAGTSASQTPWDLLSHLLRASTERTHARTLLQIWSESAWDLDLADVTEQTTRELRSSIQECLTPWCREHAPAGESEGKADSLTDAVLTALQGFLVRLAIDPEVDTEMLTANIVAAFHQS